MFCKTERLFSTHKRIKSYLRNFTSELRLNRSSSSQCLLLNQRKIKRNNNNNNLTTLNYCLDFIYFLLITFFKIIYNNTFIYIQMLYIILDPTWDISSYATVVPKLKVNVFLILYIHLYFKDGLNVFLHTRGQTRKETYFNGLLLLIGIVGNTVERYIYCSLFKLYLIEPS